MIDIKAITRRCQQNDSEAQTLFYDYFKRKLMGLCLRYAKTSAEADDIFQESFIKIFTQLDKLRDVNAVEAWVRRIVVNKAVDYYRSTFNQVLKEEVKENHKWEDAEYEAISRLGLEDLQAVISKLPHGYRMIFNLYMIEGYEHHEIAEMLKISVGTSKSQLSRAKESLRKTLGEVYE